jgi:hypothetical protein
MKLKFIEEVTAKIYPICKNDKDIKLCKFYLVNFMAFLCAFVSKDDQRSFQSVIHDHRCFDLALFLLDTVNIPAGQNYIEDPETEFSLSPINQMVHHILLFIRNSISENRQNKVHFLKNDDFLPCLMALVSQ